MEKLKWPLIILISIAIGFLYNDIHKLNNKTADIWKLGYLEMKIDNTTHPRLSFMSTGLTKVNDKLMLVIHGYEKYLSGYKIKIGVLNTSSVAMSNVKLAVHKGYEKKEVATININRKINSSTMRDTTLILKNVTEKDLTNSSWYISYKNAIYSYSHVKN